MAVQNSGYAFAHFYGSLKIAFGYNFAAPLNIHIYSCTSIKSLVQP